MAFRNGKTSCALCDTSSGGGPTPVARRIVISTVLAATPADTDMSGPSNDANLSADLGDISAGTFITDYTIYLNGQRQASGIDALANRDVYPGTSLANGQLRFERKLKVGDVITLVDWVE